MDLVDGLTRRFAFLFIDNFRDFGDNRFVDGQSSARLSSCRRERLFVHPFHQLTKSSIQQQRKTFVVFQVVPHYSWHFKCYEFDLIFSWY